VLQEDKRKKIIRRKINKEEQSRTKRNKKKIEGEQRRKR
jgi:hypothetical protein